MSNGITLGGGLKIQDSYFVPAPPVPLAGSLSFNGSTSFLALNPGVNFSTGAFTIEGWFYNNSDVTSKGLIGADETDGMSLFTTDDTMITIDKYGGGGQINYSWSAGTVKTNTWQYIVLNRNSDLAETMWIADYGSSVATRAISSAGGEFGGDIGIQIDDKNWGTSKLIGSYYGGKFPGFMTNMRVTTNVARYDSNSSTIPVPTAQLTTNGDTYYLMLGATVTTDTSSIQTVTNNNTVTQNASKPF